MDNDGYKKVHYETLHSFHKNIHFKKNTLWRIIFDALFFDTVVKRVHSDQDDNDTILQCIQSITSSTVIVPNELHVNLPLKAMKHLKQMFLSWLKYENNNTFVDNDIAREIYFER